MQQQYVGTDLHRRRSVIVRMDADGESFRPSRSATTRWLRLALAGGGPGPGGGGRGLLWVVLGRRLLQASGATVHLVTPSGLHWGNRWVKNDERDAPPRSPIACVATICPRRGSPRPKTRELRELVRYRAKLVALRSGLKAQVHAVLAKQGVIPKLDDVFGPTGQLFLDEVPLDHSYAVRVESLRDLIEIYDREIDMLERDVYSWLRGACATAVEVRRQP